jgi:hypothetical protein
MKQFPGLSFEVVAEKFEENGQSLEDTAWALVGLVGGVDSMAPTGQYESMAPASPAADGPPPLMSRSDADAALSADIPSNGDAERDRKCREAVAELLSTEESYTADVKALLVLLLEPMKTLALSKSGASKQLCAVLGLLCQFPL